MEEGGELGEPPSRGKQSWILVLMVIVMVGKGGGVEGALEQKEGNVAETMGKQCYQ